MLFIVYLLFSGCENSSLKLSVLYETLGELKSKGPVYFEKIEIGHIDKIVSTDQGDYLVEVSIYSNHKDKATENSKFFILDDPFDASKKAIVVEQKPPGGMPLKNRSVIQGEKDRGLWDGFVRDLNTSTQEASEKVQKAMKSLKEAISGNSHRLNKQLERSLDDMDGYLQDFSNSMNSALNPDDFEKLKRALEDFVEDFKSSSKELQNFIKSEIIPKLQKSLEGLRDRLQDNGQEDEAEEIDRQINELLKV